ncbi:MAG: hypothetical protein HWQ44_31475 [Nostoc sp. JL34]|nr:hypothetical protein [Nostoc sp. JL34]
MINQHLQTATLPEGVATAIPSLRDAPRTVSFANAELQDFIAACRDPREARKALAVKLVVP